ncbi:hypothetical protein JOC36_000897 [Weissella uvarum]|nr:hypothetical protein [Weissella uvarum]
MPTPFNDLVMTVSKAEETKQLPEFDTTLAEIMPLLQA